MSEELPRFELDPVHFANKLLTPFLAYELLEGQGASNEQILREACTMAEQLAEEASKPGLQLMVVNKKLAPADFDEGISLRLPLLVSHICVHHDRIAVAPSVGGKFLQLCDVWVVKVNGGEAETLKVAGHFAACGAVRYDLSEVYALGPTVEAELATYRAQQVLGESSAVVKVIPTKPQTEKRLLRELELHHLCHEHANVSQIMGIFQVEAPLGPGCAVAMSAMSQDLFFWVMMDGSEGMWPRVMQGLLSALHFLHQNDICYRNVSPQSIHLSTEMRPLLTDFCLALPLLELKHRPIQLGRPGYTAPEILLNLEPTLQSDIFSAGAVLYFLMAKQQPFLNPDLEAAVNQSISQKSEVDAGPATTLVRGLLEKSPQSRFDALTALQNSYLQADDGGSLDLKEDLSKTVADAPREWQLSFAVSGRHEPLVYRRRYLLSSGATKSLLQIIPYSAIRELPEMSHTVWQTLELDGCLQVPLSGLEDLAEPYTPLPEAPARAPDRVTTGSLRAPAPGQLQSCFHRQASTGSAKKLRIDTLTAPLREEDEPSEREPARGQPAQWMHAQQAAPEGQQVSRDMFGTCAFSQRTNEEGQRKRFVKKLGDQDEEDFDGTASWQSWRSDAMMSHSSRSRGRSGSVASVASCMSNASAVAMRELLLAASEDEGEESPPMAHRGSLRTQSPHQRLSVPGQDRRPMLQATPPPPQRDWGTCQFTKEQGAGGRSRRMVRALQGPASAEASTPEVDEPLRDLSWSSMAAERTQRSMSQASVVSDMSGIALGPSPSGEMMKELLHGDFSPQGEVARKSSRRGTAHQLQDFYKGTQ